MFLGNSHEIYEKFFGAYNPMANDYEPDGSDVFGSFLNDAIGGKRQPKHADPQDIECTVECSLEEFYNGRIKSLKYERNQVYPDGRTLLKVEDEIQFEVKPGFEDGTVLTFKKRGHEQFGHPRSNLMIKLVQKEEQFQNFRRSGNDLIYTHTMTLEEALASAPIQFTTLDGRSININLDQMITPQVVHKIEGEGMPKKHTPMAILENGSMDPRELDMYLQPLSSYPKGNLFVHFLIEFPKYLSSEQKHRVVELLRAN
uniref:Chaperone DnaJ C-terminal domain-containing protein n=1 Tax=Strombidium rassoulzadegani TaxID=1082188 RepID=A0A7S3CTH2_9SPIT|mmetsp:Transcript_8204/g.13744  ORF Transcript_8204/g.13744 Transcript_8204/m.13744 type:complete len:257 (+) Transcript_8204:261-1031(+)